MSTSLSKTMLRHYSWTNMYHQPPPKAIRKKKKKTKQNESCTKFVSFYLNKSSFVLSKVPKSSWHTSYTVRSSDNSGWNLVQPPPPQSTQSMAPGSFYENHTNMSIISTLSLLQTLGIILQKGLSRDPGPNVIYTIDVASLCNRLKESRRVPTANGVPALNNLGL